MNIVFRPLEVHDLPELRSWFKDAELSHRMSYPSDEWLDYVMDGSVARCWIADENGHPITEIQVDRDGEELGYLDIAVRPDLRGQGVGRAVLTAFLEGPGSAYPVLEGRIEPDNAASLKCCRCCGFELLEELDEDGFIRAVFDRATRNEAA